MTDTNQPPQMPAESGRLSTPDFHDSMLERAVGLLEDVGNAVMRRAQEERRWQLLRRTVLSLFVLAGLAVWVAVYAPLFGLGHAPTMPGVAVVPITGEIGGMGDARADLIVPRIQAACADDRMQALVLRISSPGGSPTGAERISQSLEDCRTGDHAKPVIAVIEGVGASAAYMIAIHADKIVANRYAQVGSIGAVMHAFDLSDTLGKIGVRQRTFASGDLKAGNSLFVANTPAQDELNQSLVDQVAAQFQAEVIAMRGERLKMESAPDLFSGRTWIGPKALELGLIDEVGTYEEVLEANFKGVTVNDFSPHQSIQDRLGLQSMLDTAVVRLWARVATPEVQ